MKRESAKRMSFGATPKINEEIVRVLTEAGRPLLVSEIVVKVRAVGSSVEVENEVKRCLHGPLSGFVTQDDHYRWRLARIPNIDVTPSRSQSQHAPSADQGAPLPTVAPADLARANTALEGWKKDLLDYSRRNKVLFFDSSRRTRLRLLTPDPDLVYEGLVLREKSFSFASPATGDIDAAELEEDVSGVALDEARGDIVVDYTTGSAPDVRSLQKKLYRLRSDARTVINEQGINTLHLSLGVLRWRETDQAMTWVTSPLILVPVTLNHEKNKPYRLGGFEGDVVVNPALIQKLRHDFTVELPSFDDFDGFGESPDVSGFLDLVGETVRQRGWNVAPEMWLSHFSFEKIVMYEDLSADGIAELAAAHPVLSALMQISDLSPPETDLELIRASHEASSGYPVVDADSSQLDVLTRAQSGQSLVVQGPPGTGKSQTIVNLIAQFIREEKSVLFVSEKRAALEVVHRRLREVGLSDLCLELHSHKANKREVVKDLFFAMKASLAPPVTVDTRGFEERRQLREKLDAYVRELHIPRGAGGKSAFRVHGQLAKLGEAPVVQAALPVLDPLDLDTPDESRLLGRVHQVVVAGLWDSAPYHPWRGAVFVDPPFVVRGTLEPSLQSLAASLDDLDVSLNSFAGSIGETGVVTLNDVSMFDRRLELLRACPEGIRAAWLTAGASTYEGMQGVTRKAFALADEAEALETSLAAVELERLREHEAAVTRLNEAYLTRYTSLFSRLSGLYRSDKRLLREITGRKLRYQDALDGLKIASHFHDRSRTLAELRSNLNMAIGLAEPPVSDERRKMALRLDWATQMRSTFASGECDQTQAERLAASSESVRETASRSKDAIARAMEGIGSALASIEASFPSGLDGISLGDVPLPELSARASSWLSSLDLIQEWATYFNADDDCRRNGLGPFLDRARREGLAAENLEPAIRRSIATQWITAAYREAPALAGFSAVTHEEVRRRFAELDRDLVLEARKAVLRGANQRQALVRDAAEFQDLSGGRHRHVPDRKARDEYQLIAREHEKKRRHLPLRRLLPQVPRIVSAVKPCLLMSPLSVASYLPRSDFRFDVVIFDEASQVRPADAIGSILRGGQVVVFGDKKQMPPTSFFDRQLEDEDDEENEDVVLDSRAFESILDVCGTVLPSSALRWHYRSRDERLIAFSNRRFYSEQPLFTFPTPDMDGDTGVRFRLVADGLYARGGSKTNLIEAREVADLVLHHFETRGFERSLGVIALSINQRDAIELEIRRAIQERPELEVFMSETGPEPFFVKNLETVQGDERDSIVLSLGYGPSEPGGLPALFFGPVNKVGGERRLNVAITRAKYELTLVSSMRPEHLDRAHDLRNEGPKVLADYVEYVYRGGAFAEDLQPGQGSPESDFEEAVWAALASRHLRVDAQVGSSGYRIDLAVRHPDAPSRYILAIECDGAGYHSSAHARDRDRLREEVLQSQGWNIERIWSYDWIQYPEKVLDRIEARIEALRASEETGLRVLTPLVREPVGPVIPVVEPHEVQITPSLPVPFIEEQKGALVSERLRLDRQLESLRAQDPSARQSDKGFAEIEVTRTLGQRQRQVNDALVRIEAGVYGVCARCGNGIEIERLEAVPSTTLCRSCSSLSAESE